MLPLARLPLFALCGVTGYFASRTFATTFSPPQRPAAREVRVPAPGANAPALTPELARTSNAESSLITEWEQLLAQHGSTSAEMPAREILAHSSEDKNRQFEQALKKP